MGICMGRGHFELKLKEVFHTQFSRFQLLFLISQVGSNHLFLDFFILSSLTYAFYLQNVALKEEFSWVLNFYSFTTPFLLLLRPKISLAVLVEKLNPAENFYEQVNSKFTDRFVWMKPGNISFSCKNHWIMLKIPMDFLMVASNTFLVLI